MSAANATLDAAKAAAMAAMRAPVIMLDICVSSVLVGCWMAPAFNAHCHVLLAGH
jgi:hypothetical protein